ncbi:hypothetical protein AB4Z55_27195 [Gordonia sp. ABKF26]|jgi:hypothetical protein|uniref:hypothetical protein n=1 Tax=Gordonia sp. ABKF26 TaxID=3238687 RepID=UPI0034E3F27B
MPMTARALSHLADDELPFGELLEALFTHLPGLIPGTLLTGDEVCRRAHRSHPGQLHPPALSSLRHGRVQSPSLTTVAALAAGFDVDIAFFTTDFHHRHRREPMAQRVLLARINQRHYQLAAALYDLPPHSRDAVLTLLGILTSREAATERRSTNPGQRQHG